MTTPDVDLKAAAIYSLLARCRSPRDVQVTLRTLRASCPELLTRVCLEWLATRPFSSHEEALRLSLIVRGDYILPLLDLPLPESLAAARLIFTRDPDLGQRLYSLHRDRLYQRPHLIRVLELVDQIQLVDRVVPLIRELTKNADGHVRAKAAAVFCKSRPNRANIKRQISADNPRVRATAAEALWHSADAAALDLMRGALRDPVPRVVANAALGLYYAGEGGLVDVLRAILEEASPDLQLSLAWAMGRMPTIGVRALLQPLAESEDQRVRAMAISSLNLLPIDEPTEAQPIEAAVEPSNTPEAPPIPQEPRYAPAFTLLD